jgi:acetyl-CoA C-acetyltransferase
MSSLQPQTIRFGSSAGEVDEVIFGQVLTANQGQNPARQAAIKAGIPQDKTAFGLNQVCGSGLRAVALGVQQIANGDAKIIVAGGQESMSLSQHGAHLRAGTKMGDLKFVDTMLRDGLMDVFNDYHMGQDGREYRSNSNEKRLARLLLLLANFDKDEKPEPILAKISQETLADMIGTTRSRVSFFMNKFRKLGLIDYNGGIEVHSSLLNVVLHEEPHIRI